MQGLPDDAEGEVSVWVRYFYQVSSEGPDASVYLSIIYMCLPSFSPCVTGGGNVHASAHAFRSVSMSLYSLCVCVCVLCVSCKCVFVLMCIFSTIQSKLLQVC